MTIDYTALATEINTDPKALGYAGKSDYEIAQLLNTAGLSGETITRQWTDTGEVVAAIVATEWSALSAASKQFLELMVAAPKVKTGSANVRTSLAGIFTAGTTSRANLIAAASKSATRAEVLFGEGTSVSDIDVARALGRG